MPADASVRPDSSGSDSTSLPAFAVGRERGVGQTTALLDNLTHAVNGMQQVARSTPPVGVAARVRQSSTATSVKHGQPSQFTYFAVERYPLYS